MESQLNDNFNLEVDLRRYAALLWRWAWLIVLAVVVAAGATYAFSRSVEPVYQATVTVLINEAPSTKVSDYAALLTSERLARTYSEMLNKRPILEEVLARLEELNKTSEYTTVDQIANAISVKLVPDTQLIEVSVEDTDPERAAVIANLIVDEFKQYNEALQSARFAESKTSLQGQIDQLSQQIDDTVRAIDELGDDPAQNAERTRLEAELAQYRLTYSELVQNFEQIRVLEAQSTSNIIILEPAVPPRRPIRPRVMVNTILAAVVGGIMALGVVILMDALDDTIKSPDDVTRLLGLPVLGTILKHETENGDLVTLQNPRSPIAEAYRSLRTNIQYASVDFPVRTFLVTSVDADAGKSTVSANLGVVMAQGGKRVIVLDADMRRPTQHNRFKVPNRVGLTSYFVQTITGEDGALPQGMVQQTSINDLYVITIGKIPPNPSELLASEKMGSLLRRLLSQVADVVIVDTPPVLAVTDAVVLAPKVDGVLLIVEPGKTRRRDTLLCVEQLRHVGANLLGVVINRVDSRSGHYGYYYYYYRSDYYHTDNQSEKKWKVRWKKRSKKGSLEY